VAHFFEQEMLVFIKQTSSANNKKRRAVKMIGIIIVSFIALVLLTFFGVIREIIPAATRANHKINTPNGIDLMELVEIGGIKQALYFRGQDKDNPVILFLHGGPGFANIPFIHTFQYDWENDFTIVNWDQRNSGKTLAANDPAAVADTLTIERAVADAHEVTQYIKQKLGKEKIIVLGQSWGAALGTILVQTYPEDYSMYIGTGQAANGIEGARLCYEKALELSRAAGNQKDVDALMALAPYPPAAFDESIFHKAEAIGKYQAKYKIGVSVGLDTLLPAFTSPYYTTGEIIAFIKGVVNQKQYHSGVYPFFFEYNAHNYGTDYQIPIYYIQGENDWQTPYPLAKAFFEEISAPDKVFFTIPNAGHFTTLDNKDEFTRVLLEEIRPLLEK
jgi:pimeloyl-ACP methyl ester carboxylesterase